VVRALCAFFQTNTAFISSKDFLNEPALKIKTNLTSIEEMAEKQAVSIRYASERKKNLRQAVSAKAKPLLAALKAFGIQENAEAILFAVPFAPSALDRMSAEEFLYQAEKLAAVGRQYATELLPWEINDSYITGMDTAIAEFRGWLGKPEELKGQRKSYTSGLQELIDATKKLMEDWMDPGVESVEAINPEFYSAYFNIRRKDDPAYRQLSYNLVVTDSRSGLPVKDALVSFVPWDVSKRTAEKGGIRGHLAEGTGTVRVTMKGYKPLELPFYVNPGNTVQEVLRLERE